MIALNGAFAIRAISHFAVPFDAATTVGWIHQLREEFVIIQMQNAINALKALRPKSRSLRQLKVLRTQVDELLDLALTAHNPHVRSFAQLKQDIFVLLQTGYKKNGFFVEFGATNGITLSNTYLLEKHFGWTSILAEPATLWHAELSKNRMASVEHDCVWKNSGEELLFNMTEVGEMSTIDAFSHIDSHSKIRSSGDKYVVQTISLNDLLLKHNAPKDIDYMPMPLAPVVPDESLVLG